MDDPQAKSFLLCPIANLQQTTRIRSGYDPRACLLDILKLTFQQLLSHIRLDNIINSGAAAAEIGARQFAKRQSRYGRQQLARRRKLAGAAHSSRWPSSEGSREERMLFASRFPWRHTFGGPRSSSHPTRLLDAAGLGG